MARNKNLDLDGVERRRELRSQKWRAQGQAKWEPAQASLLYGICIRYAGTFGYLILSSSQFNLDVEVK